MVWCKERRACRVLLDCCQSAALALIMYSIAHRGSSRLDDPASVGVDAQYASAVMHRYLLEVHGRNGVRNDGRGTRTLVHYGRWMSGSV